MAQRAFRLRQTEKLAALRKQANATTRSDCQRIQDLERDNDELRKQIALLKSHIGAIQTGLDSMARSCSQTLNPNEQLSPFRNAQTTGPPLVLDSNQPQAESDGRASLHAAISNAGAISGMYSLCSGVDDFVLDAQASSSHNPTLRLDETRSESGVRSKAVTSLDLPTSEILPDSWSISDIDGLSSWFLPDETPIPSVDVLTNFPTRITSHTSNLVSTNVTRSHMDDCMN